MSNFLDMSDEELMKAPTPDFEALASKTPVDEVPTAPVVEDEQEEKTPVVEAAEDANGAGTAPVKDEADEDDEPTKKVVEKDDKSVSDADALAALAKEAAAEKKPEGEVTDPAKKVEEEAKAPEAEKKPEPVNYEAEYARLMAPFKANGREVQAKSVDDAIALMQMGANYNKKMAALKPNLKLLKLLENNGLLDENKLSFLIDVDKKSPQAITKLLKESGLNPMDLDIESTGEYTPKTHTVDDREVALDTVLEEISDTASYTRTLSIISKEWDGKTKQIIADNPELIRVINDHVERGIYDVIAKEVESERVFGRLKGLSDIEAYRQVGDAIQARGGFNSLGSVAPEKTTPTTPPVIVPPKPKKAEEDERERDAKRRAASPSRPASPSGAAAKSDLNPLSMSDAEFEKQVANRFK